MMEELTVRYDARNSFYGKAMVDYSRGVKTLFSYGTKVVTIKNNIVTLGASYDYSQTTLRHVKEFLKQANFKADSIHQILKDYGDDISEEGTEDFSWRIFLLDRGLH